MELDFQQRFRDIITKMDAVGQEYALAKGQSWQAQELKHSILSSIMNSLEGPISQREMQARASDDYKKYIAETAQAITKELKLKSTYEKYKASFEAMRSLSSLEKSIINKTE